MSVSFRLTTLGASLRYRDDVQDGGLWSKQSSKVEQRNSLSSTWSMSKPPGSPTPIIGRLPFVSFHRLTVTHNLQHEKVVPEELDHPSYALEIITDRRWVRVSHCPSSSGSYLWSASNMHHTASTFPPISRRL